jgi:hypothetical protein
MRALVRWLLDRGYRTPYFHLQGYMLRFWIFGGSARDERCDADRGWRRRWLGQLIGRFVAARVHVILRSDNERHLHNHPFRYLTVILEGGYWEVTRDRNGVERRKWYGPGSIVWRGLNHWHCLELPPDQVCTTLFFMGRKRQSWGFDTEHGFVHWRNYERYLAWRDGVREQSSTFERLLSHRDPPSINSWMALARCATELLRTQQRWDIPEVQS